MEHSKKMKLKSLNPFITCYICKGYLIDATTVIDCLHTFCKSCLLKHFETNKTCPKCEIVIHHSHPTHYVAFDRTMQDIVFKLVPKISRVEEERREKFHTSRGLPYESTIPQTQEDKVLEHAEKEAKAKETDYHKKDEQVCISLASQGSGVRKLKRRYIRVSTHVTITHLKKYIAFKTYSNIDRFKDIDILCNNELMGKDHSLKFIHRTRWRTKSMPIEFLYRKHVEF